MKSYFSNSLTIILIITIPFLMFNCEKDEDLIISNINGYWLGETNQNGRIYMRISENEVIFFEINFDGGNHNIWLNNCKIIDDKFSYSSDFSKAIITGTFKSNTKANGTYVQDSTTSNTIIWTANKQ